MAETFHPFPDLPKELRLQIWKQAMIEARPDRRIIVYKLRVVPFKQSISPLLLVNHESRTCAKAFYNVKLDIHEIPPLDDSQIKLLDKQEQWARIPGIERVVDDKIHGYTDEWIKSWFEIERFLNDRSIGRGFVSCVILDGSQILDLMEEQQRRDIDREENEYTVNLKQHWAVYVEEQLRVFGSKSAVKAETLGPIKGAFYISPEHDVFIEGCECGSQFYSEHASKIFGADLKQRIACHHISGRLDAAIRERVSTLVLVERQHFASGHCVFASGRAFMPFRDNIPGWDNFYLRWILEKSLENFPSVDSYFTLCPSHYKESDFLNPLTKADGPDLSKILDQWVKRGSSLDREGRTEWSFEKTKESGMWGSDLEIADWTRDLMAHWDVGETDSACDEMATEQ